ncbi:hypothetical protein QNO07_02360 [Streptomyces sp. 549]|uniref:hypothetical protein n=1 Tax=Streptomyces sp. 549 TaxID=3049076 RepID=UPI0024C34419|nr:hypothetical protein [Streptomyces sp. 549]MDK1472279.1 hypothetical protein [Streptomyces sp. 549]
MSCSGPGGVDLGTDWDGAQAFALAEVGGELAVIGVNPKRGTAESLAVVPSQADDEDAVVPQLVHTADGRWIVSVPRTGGKPDRRYEIDKGEHTLTALGDGAALHGLYATRSRLVAVPSASGPLLVSDPEDGSTTRTVVLPDRLPLAAADRHSDTLCVGTDAGTYSVVDVVSGQVRPVPARVGDLEVSDLACTRGRPVLVGGKGADTSVPRIAMTSDDAATVVRIEGGRPEAVAVSGDTVAVALRSRAGIELVELDLGDGSETRRVGTELSGVDSLRRTATGWLLFSRDSVAVVRDQGTTVETIDLPGPLLRG